MSFGTNDLTQMTYVFSWDDAGRFIPEYVGKSLINAGPFLVLDQSVVGDLMKIALERSKKVKPRIKYGICGEYGGNAESMMFCHNIGLDYVSCSPFRLPIARISAAQAAVQEKTR
jgi:pyruvate,orthophosphate dikinase